MSENIRAGRLRRPEPKPVSPPLARSQPKVESIYEQREDRPGFVSEDKEVVTPQARTGEDPTPAEYTSRDVRYPAPAPDELPAKVRTEQPEVVYRRRVRLGIDDRS